MGYGAMQLAGPGVFGPPRDPGAARAVLRRAIELGVDHIDTSQYYGPDVVNDLIRQALHPYPENLKLVTKVGARRDEAGRVLPAQRPDELRDGVEANLRSLRVERLDLVNLRLVRAGRRRRDTARGAVVRARGHAPGGQARSDRALQRRSGAGPAVRSSSSTWPGSRTATASSTARTTRWSSLPGEREIAFVPFFPLGSSFRGGPARLAGRSHDRSGRGQARGHADPNRTGVVAGSL